MSQNVDNYLIFKLLNQRFFPTLAVQTNQKRKNLMNKLDKVIEIFCSVDDFCKAFEQEINQHMLTTTKPKRQRASTMSYSEVITIMILFHLGSFRNMKHFYIGYVQKHLQQDFQLTVSYNRFVELMQQSLLPMVVFLKMRCLGKCTGISFVDSTKLSVCNVRRIHSHKVFNPHCSKKTHEMLNFS